MTVCKLFFSKITEPFRQKSPECALKLTDLWNTILQLFDLNYKFELVGASLLVLATSIYYIDLARAKSEALDNIYKIQNHVMLSGEGNTGEW